MTVKITFDDSLAQKHSGACFTILARDQKHARLIAEWLREVSTLRTGSNTELLHLTAVQELPPQSVSIQV